MLIFLTALLISPLSSSSTFFTLLRDCLPDYSCLGISSSRLLSTLCHLYPVTNTTCYPPSPM